MEVVEGFCMSLPWSLAFLSSVYMNLVVGGIEQLILKVDWEKWRLRDRPIV